jgi:hypothetical protein
MKKLLFLLLLPLQLLSQFSDDFSDLNLSHNPQWIGDTGLFTINSNEQLRLYSSGSDTSILVTKNDVCLDTEWQIWIKLSFSPSNNNQLRIYLMSDSEHFTGPLNGYYISIGETGSDDSVDLFRQDGETHIKLVDGIDASCGLSLNTLRIRVIRDSSGNWTLFSDVTGGTAYQLEGSVMDDTYTYTNWFGIFCKYTSSNAQKYYFDDFYVGNILVDTLAPSIEQFFLQAPSSVQLQYSEALDTNTVNVLSFVVDNAIGNPVGIAYNDGIKIIELYFANRFEADVSYTMTISGIGDQSGNIMQDTTISFSWHLIKENDVIINEIMADPNPAVDLPEAEYLELYNKSSFPVNVNGWQLRVANTVKEMPAFVMNPASYLILCSTTRVDDFKGYGNVLGIASFPSLTNAGAEIVIIDSAEQVINSVHYADDWYDDPVKGEGGWSLERINPANHCSRNTNWTASNSNKGGTPGYVNSVLDDYVDNESPELLIYNFESDTLLTLEFNEEILIPLNLFELILAETATIDSIYIHLNTMELFFHAPFSQGDIIKLEFNGISDGCENLLFEYLELTFYQAQQYDILITEIMADPSPAVELPELEYLEIVNRSSYSINLKGWTLLLGKTQRNLEAELINQDEVIVLCPSNHSLSFGPFIRTMDILGNSDLSNDGKEIAILDQHYRVVSSVEYTSDWYSESFKAEGGWSLERIDLNNKCGQQDNWKASDNSIGGTPGSMNSVDAINPDYLAPIALRALWIDSLHVEIVFNESIDTTTILTNSFTLDGIEHPLVLNASFPLYRSIQLTFVQPFSDGFIHTIEVGDMADCCGNVMIEPDKIKFGEPQQIEPFDVVINEILFNPAEIGIDYVELYNRSEKIIDLKSMKLANWDDYESSLGTIKELSEAGYLLFPADYLVLCAEPNAVVYSFPVSDSRSFIDPPIKLPSFPNEQGRVVLLDQSFITIDDFSYHEDLHFALLNVLDGVALERVNHDWPTNDAGTWHSASEQVYFGTPGERNSQFTMSKENSATLNITPEIFSPDNDGFDDILQIQYSMQNPGYVGSMQVFDAWGRLVKQLLNHESLSSNGTIIWDGISDDDTKAGLGIYILLFEYFSASGEKGNIKGICVIGGILNQRKH